MDTKNIQLKTLFTAIALVVLLELIGSVFPAASSYQLLTIGFIRGLDIICLLLVVFLFEKNISCIGLHSSGICSALQKGVLWSIGFGLLAAIAGSILALWGIHPLELIKVRLPDASLSLLLYFFIGGIVGPAAEEIFFRGLIYRFFRRWGFLFSLIFSTLVFAAMHPMAPAIPIPQLVGGLLFALSFEIEKNLLVPISIHILGNLAIFSFSILSG